MKGEPGGEIPRATPGEFSQSDELWSNLEKAYSMLCDDRPDEPVDILYFFGRSYFDAGKSELYQIGLIGAKESKDHKASFGYLDLSISKKELKEFHSIRLKEI